MTATTERLSTALAGRYRIERHLGEGGMASVYLCEDLKHDRKVALKLLKPELAAVLGAERFVQEIKTTASLSHPHILPLFDSGTADGFLFYVMPFIEGETLRDKLNRETQLGVEEAVRIAREVADALDYAHRRGVIHRDIKPENILLHDGRPMVADFGIALAVSAAAGGRMTETGLSLGTPHYMSPEQATAEKEITPRSDVYSLASVLYEMLSGEPPHTGGSAQQVIMKIITDVAQPVSALRKSVPPNVSAALAQALEKLPADRFVSAAEFARALGDASFRGSSGSGTASATTASGIGAWKLAVSAVVLLGAGTAIGGLLSKTEPLPEQVVRFAVPIPPSERFPTNPGWDAPFALSADGSRFAYLASDSAITSYRVRVRQMDQITSIVLPGTEDAVNPFFSPDGKWIGFVGRGNVLRKVATTGGPVSPLGPPDAGTGSGAASWGDDGFIVYPRLNQLARISEGGGEVTMITDSVTVAYAWAPTVLPGGRSVLTVACVKQPALDGCASGLYVLDVPTRKLTLLVDRVSRGWYLPDGYLVYGTLDGALYAMRFDVGKLAVSGAPVALLDGVAISQGRLARVAVAQATGAMAYLPNVGDEQVVIVSVDRDGREQVLVDTPGSYAGVRLSPNERRILLTMPDASGGLQAWIHDRASATTTQLTFDGTNIRPAWSPSGDRIAFASNRRTRFYLWTMPADGSDKGDRAGEGPEINGPTPVHWTRDGKWLVIDGAPEDGKSPGGEDVFAIPTSGKRMMLPVVATAASEQSGEVSPDGKWIAYISNDAGRYQLYVQPFLAPGGRTLISAGGAQEPAWVSKSELAYVNTDVDSMVVARLEFGPTITVSRTTLFDHRPFQAGGVSQRNYDVMRDGRTFIFARPVNQRHVVEPMVVLNWVQEVRRLMAAAGVKD